mmetsp:Transcript_75934/g.158372  ORF Transcript_75934/g.158372 Transcript_75934/m.158372 type:complete len:202 (+) Transcript_75934:503-1108(+)
MATEFSISGMVLGSRDTGRTINWLERGPTSQQWVRKQPVPTGTTRRSWLPVPMPLCTVQLQHWKIQTTEPFLSAGTEVRCLRRLLRDEGLWQDRGDDKGTIRAWRRHLDSPAKPGVSKILCTTRGTTMLTSTWNVTSLTILKATFWKLKLEGEGCRAEADLLLQKKFSKKLPTGDLEGGAAQLLAIRTFKFQPRPPANFRI